mgnify:FL=1|jgi:hypothetical protein
MNSYEVKQKLNKAYNNPNYYDKTEEKIEYLTKQNKFYRTKLAQAAVKIQELKRELKRKENPETIVDELRKTGQL